MEIFIKNNRVKFKQGVQEFTLDYEGDQDDLMWMSEQLYIAFQNFMRETEKQTISDMTEKMLQQLIADQSPKGGSPKQNF